MRTTVLCALAFATSVTCQAAEEEESAARARWAVRFDVGGNIPETPSLTLYDGPVTSGDSMELTAGFQMDLAIGYRLAPWLIIEGELGMSANDVESVGNWSYPDSTLSQLALMANVVIEPLEGPWVPYAGVGAGGVYSTLTFGYYYYYYYDSSSDGYGTDFVPAAQAFAGLRYEFSEAFSIGVGYRFLATDRQTWDVDWWTGSDFEVGVNSIFIHSIFLTFTSSF